MRTCDICEKINFLKQELFFSIAEMGSIQTVTSRNCVEQMYVATKYEFVFIGRGHHIFSNLRTIMRTPPSILTSNIISASVSIILRLTLVIHVYLHYLSYVKGKLIDIHALILFKWKKNASSYFSFLCCNQRLIHVDFYSFTTWRVR